MVGAHSFRNKYYLTVNLLGNVAAAALGTPLTFRSDKVRALLAYLIMHQGEPIARAELAFKLYSEYPDQVGRKNLSLTLTRLRQTLAPVQEIIGKTPLLDSDREQVKLHWQPEHYWADVIEFAALQEACRFHPHESLIHCSQCYQRLKQMVSLHTGPFLADVQLKDSPDFNEWRLWHQEIYQQQLLELLYALTENALAAANYAEAITYARQQINLVPWQEQAHRQLIQAWMATDQPAAARSQFVALKKILAVKFQVAPGAETVALINSLNPKPIEVPAFPAPATALSADDAAALEHLSRILLDPVNRLLTLLGSAESGLTELAQRLGQRLEKQFPQGLVMVSLAQVDPTQPAALVQAIAAALPTQPSAFSPQPSTFSPQHSLLNYLRPRRLLLVLDSFTPFIQPTAPEDGVTLVMDILQNAPQVTMLVVASRPLQLQQEIVYRL